MIIGHNYFWRKRELIRQVNCCTRLSTLIVNIYRESTSCQKMNKKLINISAKSHKNNTYSFTFVSLVTYVQQNSHALLLKNNSNVVLPNAINLCGSLVLRLVAAE